MKFTFTSTLWLTQATENTSFGYYDSNKKYDMYQCTDSNVCIQTVWGDDAYECIDAYKSYCVEYLQLRKCCPQLCGKVTSIPTGEDCHDPTCTIANQLCTNLEGSDGICSYKQEIESYECICSSQTGIAHTTAPPTYVDCGTCIGRGMKWIPNQPKGYRCQQTCGGNGGCIGTKTACPDDVDCLDTIWEASYTSCSYYPDQCDPISGNQDIMWTCCPVTCSAYTGATGGDGYATTTATTTLGGTCNTHTHKWCDGVCILKNTPCGACEDQNPAVCGASMCDCNNLFWKELCPKTCGTCHCEDTCPISGFCAQMKHLCFDVSNPGNKTYMKENCARTCGYCGSGVINPSSPCLNLECGDKCKQTTVSSSGTKSTKDGVCNLSKNCETDKPEDVSCDVCSKDTDCSGDKYCFEVFGVKDCYEVCDGDDCCDGYFTCQSEKSVSGKTKDICLPNCSIVKKLDVHHGRGRCSEGNPFEGKFITFLDCHNKTNIDILQSQYADISSMEVAFSPDKQAFDVKQYFFSSDACKDVEHGECYCNLSKSKCKKKIKEL
jgi:hypothetical protein